MIIHEDDSALTSLYSALIIADAEELPPFLPLLVINGVPSNLLSSSLDSAAQICGTLNVKNETKLFIYNTEEV